MFEKTLHWFGGVIALPIAQDNNLYSPKGRDLHSETALYLRPSPTLSPFQRIELYHRQYWWRLLKTLHTNFPMLTRLFGYRHFNEQIGVPYLTANPPSHWALCRLGQTLPEWIDQHYRANDKPVVLAAAQIDRAAESSFWSAEHPSCTLSPEEMLSTPLALQPHIHLFALQSNLFSFREAFLKEEVDYWNDHPFPPLDKRAGYFVLSRARRNDVVWKEISRGEFEILSAIREGLTINEACTKIELIGGDVLAKAESEMPLWFREWVALGWLIERGASCL